MSLKVCLCPSSVHNDTVGFQDLQFIYANDGVTWIVLSD